MNNNDAVQQRSILRP